MSDKSNNNIICCDKTNIFDLSVLGLISPYPTVLKVVNEKYQQSKNELSSSKPLNSIRWK